MRLFLVWDSESISEQTDTIVEDLFSCMDGSSDSEEPRRKRRSRKVKKESSESHAVSDSESDSEQSKQAGKYPMGENFR